MQTACGYALGTVVIVGAVTAIFCMIINRTDIDITAFEITPDNTFYVGDGDSATFIRLRFVSIWLIVPDIIDNFNASFVTETEFAAANKVVGEPETLSIRVSVLVSMIAFFCILGWLFFVIFAGIGIIGLPYKLI